MRTDIIGHIGRRAENLPCQKPTTTRKKPNQKPKTTSLHREKLGDIKSQAVVNRRLEYNRLDDKRLPALCGVCVEGRIPLCLIGSPLLSTSLVYT
jgi:hypothetical protein